MKREWAVAQALIRSEWQAKWNQGWRFSRAKSGVWQAVFQIALVAALFWRIQGQGAVHGAWTTVAAICLQQGIGGFVGAYLQGRQQLYGQSMLPLVHVTPASSSSTIMAMVGASIPRRALWTLLFALTLGALQPPEARLWGVPLLWIVGLVTGVLGQLTGLFTLVIWVRLFPQALTVTWVASLMLLLIGAYYLVYLLATGIPIEVMALTLKRIQGWLLPGMVALVGLPGIVMGVWLGRRPDRVGEVYRDSWLGLKELSDDQARPLRSWLPAIGPGSFGAVAGREIVRMMRNRMSQLRFALWAVAMLVLVWLSPTVEVQRPALFTLSVGVGVTVFVFVEMAATVFSADGQALALYVVAGVRPLRLLLGKLCASTPFAALTALGTWAAGLAFGLHAAEHSRLTGVAACIGLGWCAVIVGLGAAGISLTAEEGQEMPDVLVDLWEQLPRGLGGWLSFAGGTLYAVAGVWVGATPSAHAAGGWALVLFPLAALIAGYLRLKALMVTP